MIRLHLENFRCYSDKFFEIKKDESTLLMGKSGAGKTTLCEAIVFVLYDKSPKPCSFGKTSCRVTMTDGEVEIMRQKDPCLLQFKTNGKVYEDDVAQNIIERVYGKWEIFEASCYIRQMERNPLFVSGENKKKLALIRSLTIGEVDIEAQVAKISKRIKELEEEIRRIEMILMEKKGILSHFEIPEKYYGMGDVEGEKEGLEKKEEELKNKILYLRGLVSKREEVEKGVKKLREKMEGIEVKEVEEWKREMEEVGRKLADWNVEKIGKQKEVERKKRILEELRGKWKGSDVPGRMSALKSEIMKSGMVSTWLNEAKSGTIVEMENKKGVMEKELEKYKEEWKIIETTYLFQNRNQGTLTCPKCNAKLKHDGKCLELVPKTSGGRSEPELKRIISEEEYKEKKKEMGEMEKEWQEMEDLWNKVSRYKQVRPLKEVEMEMKELEALVELEKEELQDVEITMKEEEFQTLFKTKTRLEGQILHQEKNRVMKETLSGQVTQQEGLLMELEKEIGGEKVEEREREQREVTARLQEVKVAMDFQEKIKRKQVILQEVAELDEKKKGLTSKLQGFLTLQSRIPEAESRSLQDGLAILNHELASVLPLIFDTPISVILRTEKNIKKGQNQVRFIFNLLIYYRNHEFTDLSQLSGGEQSRVSIALTLAFSRLAKKRIIMLDESLNSLDLDLKSRVIDILVGMKKTILVISHDELQGPFPNLLQI